MRSKWTHLGLALFLAWATNARAGDIAPTAEDVRPILVGSQVPDIMVEDVTGAPVPLRDALDGKPSVVIFYRGGWCPFCSQQLAELRHVQGPLYDLGVQLIGLSGDSPERLRSTWTDPSPGFTLLSDFNLEAAKAFGLAFRVSDEYAQMLAQYKLDVSGNTVDTVRVLPVPAVFVVQPNGVISFSYVNPNYRVRCDPDVLLAAARAAVKETKSE